MKDKFHGIISCTTRPPRDNEKDGEDYYFLTQDEFLKKHMQGEMLETTSFNGWYYGTTISSLDPKKINVGVFNKYGIQTLLNDERVEVYPIYFLVDDHIRLSRCLNREKNPDCDEICRRFLVDKQDFSDIPFEHQTLNNNYSWDLTVSALYSLINKACADKVN